MSYLLFTIHYSLTFLRQEEHVERDSFRKRHAENRENENFPERARIAPDGFDSLATDPSDADSCRRATECDVEASVNGCCRLCEERDTPIWDARSS